MRASPERLAASMLHVMCYQGGFNVEIALLFGTWHKWILLNDTKWEQFYTAKTPQKQTTSFQFRCCNCVASTSHYLT